MVIIIVMIIVIIIVMMIMMIMMLAAIMMMVTVAKTHYDITWSADCTAAHHISLINPCQCAALLPRKHFISLTTPPL